jgi:DNA polymerase-3 subunit beta
MLPTFDFITALKFASHAMATHDVRDYLNGVLFRFVGDTLLLAGSDGHRIAKVRLNLIGCQLSGDYIVKCGAVKSVLQSVKTKQTDTSRVKLEPAPGGKSDGLLLTAGAFVLALEVQDGRYPDFERALPNRDPEGCATIAINAPYLEAAAKALKPFSGSQYSGLLVDTWTPGETMRLRAEPENSALSFIDGEAVVYIMPMRL